MLNKKNLSFGIYLLCCLAMGWPSFAWTQSGNKAATAGTEGTGDIDWAVCPNITYGVPYIVTVDKPCYTEIAITGIPGSSTSSSLPNTKGRCECRIKNYTLGYSGILRPIVSIKLNGAEVLGDVTINTVNKTIVVPTFGGVSSSTLEIEYDCSGDATPSGFGEYHTLKGGGLCIIVDLGGTHGGSGTVALWALALDFVIGDSLDLFGGGTGWGMVFKFPFSSRIGIETEVMGTQSALLLPELSGLPQGIEPLVQLDSVDNAVRQFALLLGPALTLGKGEFQLDLKAKGGLLITKGPALAIGIGRMGEEVSPTNSVFQFAEDRADFALSFGLQFNYALSQHWGVFLAGDYFQSVGSASVYQWRDYSQAVQDPDFNPEAIAKELWQEDLTPVKSIILKAGIRYRFSLCR